MVAIRVGEGGAPAVKSRAGRSRRPAAGSLTSMVSTVGAAQKCQSPSLRSNSQI